MDRFGADIGLTVDGDGLGELNFETFHAFSYTVDIHGVNIHTAEAKGKMLNASMIAMELDRMLPERERPEYTEGREGFYHLYEMSGNVDKATMEYNLRDFETAGIENRKRTLENAVSMLNNKYGENTVTLKGVHEYSNPRQQIEQKENLMPLLMKAFEQSGISPQITPIRGGTDGSTLAEKGLACANIFLAGHNYHSIKEYVSVNGMEKSAEIIIKFLELIGK